VAIHGLVESKEREKKKTKGDISGAMENRGVSHEQRTTISIQPWGQNGKEETLIKFSKSFMKKKDGRDTRVVKRGAFMAITDQRRQSGVKVRLSQARETDVYWGKLPGSNLLTYQIDGRRPTS